MDARWWATRQADLPGGSQKRALDFALMNHLPHSGFAHNPIVLFSSATTRWLPEPACLGARTETESPGLLSLDATSSVKARRAR